MRYILYIQCICKHHKVYNNFTNPLVYIIQTGIKNRHIIMYYTCIAISTLESRFTVVSLVSHPCSVPSGILVYSRLTGKSSLFSPKWYLGLQSPYW